MREKNILINDLRVNYKIAGEGPAVLVLHGWGGSSDSWRKVQEILSEKGYNILTPDLPGFGKSVTPRAPWGINDYTDFVSSFIKETKLDNFSLLGHSFGGRIAIRFSSLYPEKINKLILCDSAGIKPTPDFKTKTIFRLAKIGNAIFTSKILERMKDSARNIFYIITRNRDYARARGVMRETIKKVLEEDLLPDLDKVSTKTLIVWGENDRIVPMKYGNIIKENIKDSEIVLIPKVGHSPHLEVPEKLSEIILKFLNE